MAVPFMDLKRAPAEADRAVREAVLRVLDHKQYILGREVEAFEAAVATSLGGAEVIGVSSGTDALLVGLMALGVGAGDRVVTTPFSFFATAGVVVRLGATPVFVDIDPQTYGISRAALDAVDRRGVKAVIPVHLFGHTLDLDPILAWAEDIPVFEDAAQAIGGRDAKERAAGTVGRLAAFSFFPTKNLGALGDAGMVVTRDGGLAATLRRLRAHGQSAQYLHVDVGGNFRIDAVQAAALAAALPFLDELVRQRRENAEGYRRRFQAAGLADGRVVLPEIGPHHTVHQYVVRIGGGRRDAVQAGLKARGIGAMVYYPIPFHRQPCFASLGYGPGDFPEAERAAAEVLALPIYPGLTSREQDEVVDAVSKLL